mgnify:CR=1 FL=1
MASLGKEYLLFVLKKANSLKYRIVYRARWRGTTVAVKKIFRTNFRNDDQVSLFVKEVKVMR